MLVREKFRGRVCSAIFRGLVFFQMVRETIEASNKTSTTLEGFALRRWCWHWEDLETLIFMRSCRYVLLAVSASILQRLRPPSAASRATFPLLRRLFGLEKHGQSLCGVTRARGRKGPAANGASYLESVSSSNNPGTSSSFVSPVHNGEGDFRIYWVSDPREGGHF